MSGRLTIDNLSDNLKEYLNGLGLTEDQINTIIQNKTGDLSTLTTDDKSTLVKAVNEVKTKVDSGQNHKMTKDNGNVLRPSDGTDLNTLTLTSEQYVAAPVNGPLGTTGAWYIEVKSMGSGYVYQRATRNSGGDNVLEKYERTLFNNTWTAWRSL